MMTEKDKVKLLTGTSPAAVVVPAENDGDDVSGTRRPYAQHHLNRRWNLLRWCCGGFCATVAVFGVVVLVLSLTLFKLKDATLTMNSLVLDSVSLNLGTVERPTVTINATLIAGISIRNPNAASFRFGASTTEFYYGGGGGGGTVVGVAYAPGGKVGARRTARMDVRVEVMTNRVAEQMDVRANVLLTGPAEVNLTSFTDIAGKVSMLGIFKRELELMMNCSLTLELSITEQELTRTQCFATVK